MVQLAQKKQQYATYEECLDKAKVSIVAEYRGLSVAQLTQLRSELFQQQAKFVIVKNTILKRAVKGKAQEAMEHLFTGPNAILFAFEDEVTPLKTLKKYFKQFKIGEVKGGMLGNDLLDADGVNELSELPPLEELRGKLLGAINTPNSRLVHAINSQVQGLVNILSEYNKIQPQN